MIASAKPNLSKKYIFIRYTIHSIVSENIIETPKIRNNFGAIKFTLFSNIAIVILVFSLLLSILLSIFQLCNSKSCRSLLHFCIDFVHWLMASFLHCFPLSFGSSNYCAIRKAITLEIAIQKRSYSTKLIQRGQKQKLLLL